MSSKQDEIGMLPLYRFLVGNGGNRLIGRKDVVGEVDAVCLVEATLAAEKKFASVPSAIEVLSVAVQRQEPDGRWVPSPDCPETLEDALIYAREEAGSVSDAN
jgi:hypothetical protein